VVALHWIAIHLAHIGIKAIPGTLAMPRIHASSAFGYTLRPNLQHQAMAKTLIMSGSKESKVHL